jgi:membrane protein DedA with SNARE-associated domain
VGDAISSLVGDLARWLTEAIYFFGYPGVAISTALSNLLLLIPTQLVLAPAGYEVSQGRFSLPLVLVAATMGSLVSALILYALGRWVGEESLRRFIGRFSRFTFIGESDLDKAGKAFDRYGGEAVLISVVLPGVGNLISVPAGIERMSIWQFAVYATLGNALRNGTYVGLGWVLGYQWTLVEQYTSIIKYAALVIIVGGIFWFLWGRWKAHRG